MENREKAPSCEKIILWFILFYPVGIFFLCKRIKYNRGTARKFRKILKVFGYFCLVGAVFMLIGLTGSQNDNETEGFAVVFLGYLILGGFIIYASKHMEKFENHYIIYKDIIMNQNERNIQNIALQVGLSCKRTEKELQKMINKGYFDDAYINMESYEIVVPNRAQPAQAPVSRPVSVAQTAVPPNRSNTHQSTGTASQPNRIYVRQSTSTAQPSEKVVKCPNCGGMNTIRTGTISECDFCGSPIS